eukprot:s1277_g18.t2
MMVSAVPPQSHGKSDSMDSDPDLLASLRRAGLEDWYSKFVSFGYETAEDVRGMNEHDMKEIGLQSGHRIRLMRAFGLQRMTVCTAQAQMKKDTQDWDDQTSPPQCQQPSCKSPADWDDLPSPATIAARRNRQQSCMQPQCQQPSCKSPAVMKCQKCGKLICLVHQTNIMETEKIGNTTVRRNLVGCEECRFATGNWEDCKKSAALAWGFAVIVGGIIMFSVISSSQ